MLKRFILMGLCLFVSQTGWSQVVQFRLETVDDTGNPTDTVNVGDAFALNVYTQHVGGYVSEENSGVFAAFLDVAYDAGLASVSGDIEHAAMYQNAKRGDLSTSGLLNDIGGVSSSGEQGWGIDPLGLEEHLVFQVPFQADSAGQFSFVGSSAAGDDPFYDVLVYGLNVPVPAQDVDFGEADLRLAFGTAALSIQAVPEPDSCVLFCFALVASAAALRRRR